MENNIPENNEMLEQEQATVQSAQEKSVIETVVENEIPEAVQEVSVRAEEPVAEEKVSAEDAELTASEAYRTSPFADGPYVTGAVEEKPKKTKRSSKSKKGLVRALCAVLTVVLIAGSCLITAAVLNESWEDRLEDQADRFEQLLEDATAGRKPLGGSSDNESGTPVQSVSGSKSPAQVYAENVDTVVMVYCEHTEQQGLQITTGYSTGSGFIITEDGYVVTNAHVVEGANNIFVTIYDNTEYLATLVGMDSVNDVALLKIDATDLDYAVIGSSDDLIVGDQVVAIGNPLGELTSTLTVGYVSAKERDVSTEGNTINMLQTDAAINSGNSGGPLFNMNGEVVGITTAKYSGTTESGAVIEGIGFAIPVDDVYDLLADLKDYGFVTGAYLGVSVSDTDPAAAAYFGMPVGAYVHEAVPGYCAAAAGIQPKDIIVALGEYEISNISELTRVLRKFEAGDTTTITIYRGGQQLVLDITLDAKPENVG